MYDDIGRNVKILFMFTLSGQTWTMTILRLIQEVQDVQEDKDVSFEDIFFKIPFMEVQWADGEFGAEKFNKLKPPRIMKTHLPYPLWKHQFEKHPNLKVKVFISVSLDGRRIN